MKSFLIGGSIVSDSSEAWAYEDVTPTQVRAFLSKLEPGEDATFEISSPGGSVVGGIAIANLIREASKGGHPCKCHVVGIAASMASVIACACDEIEIDESAFFMIHNPWSICQGDADDLRKEAAVLDQMKSAILSFYRSKFDKTDEELCKLMDDETWFTGSSSADFAFKATVIPTAGELKAAACARNLPAFAKMPELAGKLFVLGRAVEPEAPAAPAPEVADPQPTQADGSEPDDEKVFAQRLAAAMKSRDTEINELKATIVEERKRAVETLAAREEEFKNQLSAKDKELTDVKAEVTRLASALENSKSELLAAASALAEKSNALAELNAAVNTPNAVTRRVVNARAHMASLPIGQRQQFYAEHRDAVDHNDEIKL